MSEEKPKIKVAIYWAASCGGCCVSVLDVHEALLDVVAAADFVFWPIALDTKYADVEAMEDGEIDLTLFNGAIRNAENEHLANLLRAKSKILVAYGSCSHMGGIPGLANVSNREEIFERVYITSESTENPDRVFPKTSVTMPEGELTLPEFYNDVRRLDDVVSVDYYMPGCPPQTERLVEVFTIVVAALTAGGPVPPAGAVVGAMEKGQCDECDRKKDEKKVTRFYRPWEIEDDGETCFLEQGIICMGPATRAGCGTRCITGNYPCRGCYGPTAEEPDPGAKMMSAIASMIDSNDPDEIDKVIDTIDDPLGTFYRFSLPTGILRRVMK